MSKTRRVFSKDFKAKVVLEALKEKSTIEALAKKYELLPNQISGWKAEAIKNISAVFSIEKTVVNKNDPSLKVRTGEASPKRKIVRTDWGTDFRKRFSKKKAVLIPEKDRQSMVDFNEKISVSKQCKVLNINRNFLYYVPKLESEETLKIMSMMDKQYFETPFYGYRKMTVWVQKQGFIINEKRTRRLMQLMDWQTIYREPNPSPKVRTGEANDNLQPRTQEISISFEKFIDYSKKPSMGNGHHLYSYETRIYVFDCNN